MSNNKSGQDRIPTRQGVHLRNPQNNKSSGKSPTPSASSVKKTQNVVASAKNTQKTNTQSQKPLKTGVKQGNTPVDISRKKELRELKLKQKRQREIEEKRLQQYRRNKRKQAIAKLKENIKHISLNLISGILIALVAFLIIAFSFYRNMSKTHAIKDNTTIEFYPYIDITDEDASQELIKARENGKEEPHFILSDSLKHTDGAIYLPFSAISSYFDFSIAGDTSSRTILIGNSQGQYDSMNSAVFYFGTTDIKVNGANHSLKNSAYIDKNEVYIPFEFFETFVKGIIIEDDKSKKDRNIRIYKDSESVYFGSSKNSPLEVPSIEDYVPDSNNSDYYGIDLSEYEKHINPADRDAYLTLINSSNRLSQDYAPDDLTGVIYTRPDREVQKMRLDAAKALEAFLKVAYANGHSDITVTSAYRSYSYQNSLFETRLKQNMAIYDEALAREKTAEFTAYPGTSEHQSGLCCDMHNLSSAMQSFANTSAYKWLYENCANFGFILRYPQSKEDITGISFEPWHYRFVGRYHAKKIMESGLSLEEYVELYNAGNIE